MLLLNLALKYWKAIAVVLALIALIVTAKIAIHRYDEARRAEGRAEIQAKFDAYVKESRDRSSALALALSEKRQAADQLSMELDHERTNRLQESRIKARTLPAVVAATPVPASVRDLIDSAVDSSQATGPAVEPAKTSAAPPEDTNLGAISQWAVEVIAVCSEYRDRVTEWERFYDGLREAERAGLVVNKD